MPVVAGIGLVGHVRVELESGAGDGASGGRTSDPADADDGGSGDDDGVASDAGGGVLAVQRGVFGGDAGYGEARGEELHGGIGAERKWKP